MTEQNGPATARGLPLIETSEPQVKGAHRVNASLTIVDADLTAVESTMAANKELAEEGVRALNDRLRHEEAAELLGLTYV